MRSINQHLLDGLFDRTNMPLIEGAQFLMKPFPVYRPNLVKDNPGSLPLKREAVRVG